MNIRIYTLQDTLKTGAQLRVVTDDRNCLLNVPDPTYLLDEVKKAEHELVGGLEHGIISVSSADPTLMDKLRCDHILRGVPPSTISQLFGWYMTLRELGNRATEAHVKARKMLDICLYVDYSDVLLQPGMKVWESLQWKDGYQTTPPEFAALHYLPTVVNAKEVTIPDADVSTLLN